MGLQFYKIFNKYSSNQTMCYIHLLAADCWIVGGHSMNDILIFFYCSVIIGCEFYIIVNLDFFNDWSFSLENTTSFNLVISYLFEVDIPKHIVVNTNLSSADYRNY